MDFWPPWSWPSQSLVFTCRGTTQRPRGHGEAVTETKTFGDMTRRTEYRPWHCLHGNQVHTYSCREGQISFSQTYDDAYRRMMHRHCRRSVLLHAHCTPAARPAIVSTNLVSPDSVNSVSLLQDYSKYQVHKELLATVLGSRPSCVVALALLQRTPATGSDEPALVPPSVAKLAYF